MREDKKFQPEAIRVFNVITGKYEETKTVEKSDKEWKKILADDEYHVTREHGTERAFSGRYWKNKDNGLYVCSACGNHLFHSNTKFDSGTGWPSFWEPVAQENVGTTTDDSHMMHRVEVHCSRCGAHLGHIFEDGPEPTGQRYCINSASLKFMEEKEKK